MNRTVINVCCSTFIVSLIILASLATASFVNGDAAQARQLTIPQAATALPQSSTTIFSDNTNNKIWVVNPDTNTVARLDALNLTRDFEKPVGKNPRTLAQAPDGAIWVVNQDSATISVLDQTSGDQLATITLPRASQPFGIVFSPDGQAAYVSLEATAQLAKLHPLTRSLQTLVASSVPTPRGLAITADSSRLFVTRFISTAGRTGQGEIAQFSLSGGNLTFERIIPLIKDTTPDSPVGGRGVPNYLLSLAIAPDGQRLWASAIKDNVDRGLFYESQPFTVQNTVRTTVIQMDLGSASPTEVLPARFDLDDRDFVSALQLTPSGTHVFLAVQGHNRIQVRRVSDNVLIVEPPVGAAPQGLVFNAAGTRVFIQNFLTRNVTVYDVNALLNFSGGPPPPRLAEISTIGSETLAPAVLRGKQIFYNAADPRMNMFGYISCASCHLEGGSDGQIWDFTERGEGLRNTTTLKGKAGIGQGRVHWTGNFDEIQDFENDIRNFQGGRGFLSDVQWFSGTVSQTLGTAKRGLNPDLDALAAYVSSLTEVPPSPYRNQDGTLTSAAQAGQLIFAAKNCASCHSGTSQTDSQVGPNSPRHDVGTYAAGSGLRLGQPLTGFDTPTLLGLWRNAPYLHNGSQTSLLGVINAAASDPQQRHGALADLTANERQQLADYLQQLDGSEAVQVSNLQVADAPNRVNWFLQTNLAAGELAFGDAANSGYTLQYIPELVRGLAWLRPAKTSAAYSANPLVQFTLDKPAGVYVAANVAPPWVANGWQDSGQMLVVKDSSISSQPISFRLYWKAFEAGPMALNSASGSAYPYFVIVAPNTQAPCNPLLVTTAADTQSCGTLRNAITQANFQASLVAGSYGISVTAAVSQINLTASLPAFAPGLVIQAACTGQQPQLTLNGGGTASGLFLQGNVWLQGLKLASFSGPALQARSLPGLAANRLTCLKIN